MLYTQFPLFYINIIQFVAVLGQSSPPTARCHASWLYTEIAVVHLHLLDLFGKLPSGLAGIVPALTPACTTSFVAYSGSRESVVLSFLVVAYNDLFATSRNTPSCHIHILLFVNSINATVQPFRARRKAFDSSRPLRENTAPHSSRWLPR